MEKPKLALRAWGKLGGIERVSPFGSGHINDTYLVEGAGGRYILQRINTNTFQDVDGLMQNIRLVTEFITEPFQIHLRFSSMLQSCSVHSGR